MSLNWLLIARNLSSSLLSMYILVTLYWLYKTARSNFLSLVNLQGCGRSVAIWPRTLCNRPTPSAATHFGRGHTTFSPSNFCYSQPVRVDRYWAGLVGLGLTNSVRDMLQLAGTTGEVQLVEDVELDGKPHNTAVVIVLEHGIAIADVCNILVFHIYDFHLMLIC